MVDYYELIKNLIEKQQKIEIDRLQSQKEKA